VAHLIRGHGPRSRTRHARRSRRNGRISREYTRGRRGGQTAGGSDQRRRDAGQPRTGLTLRRAKANPTGVAEFRNEPGQAAITARAAGPVRAPKERRPRMTRAGGVSTNTRRNHSETRGAKNRRGEPATRREAGLAAGPAANRVNAAAGWSGGRSPPRRNGAAGERRRDANSQTSREVADRPVRRGCGGRQIDRPGRRWWSRKRTREFPAPPPACSLQ